MNRIRRCALICVALATIPASLMTYGQEQQIPLPETAQDSGVSVPEPPDPAVLLYFFPDPVPSISVLQLLNAPEPAVESPASVETAIAPDAAGASDAGRAASPVEEVTPAVKKESSAAAPSGKKTSTVETANANGAQPKAAEASESPESGKKVAETPENSAKTMKTDDVKNPVEIVPGIWTEEPVAPVRRSDSEIMSGKDSAASSALPSRTVELSSGQFLEVLYPGSGWVFLGDSLGQNGLVYQSRKLDGRDTVFLFRASKEGSSILQFSRFDILQDAYAEDALAVSVSNFSRPAAPKIRAPAYRSAEATSSTLSRAETLAGSPSGSGSSASGSSRPGEQAEPLHTTGISAGAVANASMAANAHTVATEPVSTGSGSAVSTQGETPSVILEKARKAISVGDQQSALRELDAFFAATTENLDEGWFLRGKAYEANGALRNIKMALEAYTILIDSYPDSVFWKESDARVRYINRLYFQIR